MRLSLYIKVICGIVIIWQADCRNEESLWLVCDYFGGFVNNQNHSLYGYGIMLQYLNYPSRLDLIKYFFCFNDTNQTLVIDDFILLNCFIVLKRIFNVYL